MGEDFIGKYQMGWQKSRGNLCRIALTWLVLVASESVAAQKPTLVEFRQGDRLTTGLRLVDEPHRAVLLGRDGWLYDSLKSPRFTTIGVAEGSFTVVSSIELRGQLQAEFGDAYEVVPTEHYLVVQPRGRGNQWPNGFERMYRQFVAYMERLGVWIRKGRFPLVAIVLPDEASMRTAFTKHHIDVGRVAGVYDLSSNRVLLHDVGHAEGTAETVRHEAAHQTAYNTGVHSRVSNTPRWIVEGIGSLFEPAIMASARHGTRGDRVNRELLIRVRSQNATTGSLARDVQRLVAGDAMFQNQAEIERAYAVGWAMTFYLAERRPQQFTALLGHTNRLPPLETYGRTQRLQDFETIIDSDIQRFATRLERFLDGL